VHADDLPVLLENTEVGFCLDVRTHFRTGGTSGSAQKCLREHAKAAIYGRHVREIMPTKDKLTVLAGSIRHHNKEEEGRGRDAIKNVRAFYRS
jgi:hypothetical protein